MNRNQNDRASGVVSRRMFVASAGAMALGAVTPLPAKPLSPGEECDASSVYPLTGNGEWTYGVVSGWGKLPEESCWAEPTEQLRETMPVTFT